MSGLAKAGYLDAAADATRDIEDDYWRVEALLARALASPEPARAALLADALVAAQHVVGIGSGWSGDVTEFADSPRQDGGAKVRALVRIAGHLPVDAQSAVLSEALAAARELRRRYLRELV